MHQAKPDNMTALASALINLPVDEAVYITADDFKHLTGEDLSSPITDGRFVIGNLAARTNCRIVTTSERVVFTKNSARVTPTPPLSRAERHS